MYKPSFTPEQIREMAKQQYARHLLSILKVGDKVQNEYGKVVTVLQIRDNVIDTTNGRYHIAHLIQI